MTVIASKIPIAFFIFPPFLFHFAHRKMVSYIIFLISKIDDKSSSVKSGFCE
ncbi:hypothetical protein HMPREF1986_02354 [Oribacterium sp. oral taxon 078 str. F0263]|nr:hypothetical protein HMPREF1986_02354 [Oribacterium sp. oral taxon 078 str. F0263]